MSEKEKSEINLQPTQLPEDKIKEVTHVQGMYKEWFLDYASYVILERAVPAMLDGLKPVQRRILHSMKRMDDGRFNKIANVIGHTMQFHPHGDAAIGDAIVNLGQKELMIETQGNWGDSRTGDRAAAPRYIEGRLSKFALEIAFNPQTTYWQSSYDGRQKEPVHLPMKFPMVLAQGAEGIAVGLSTKILPHNFVELIEASIALLEKKEVNLLPDFPNGGYVDVSNYNEGMRGGRVRLRAVIENPDKKTLIVKSVPYGATTGSLIDSIIKANDNNKIKIKKVTDNTAKNVEIMIDLPPSVSPDVMIDALYAFTDCEVSISPNCCVIINEKPVFITVNELLRKSVENTVALLKWEQEIKLNELQEKFFFSSLEKIFIENRIYRDIEECETWQSALKAIDRGLDPFKPSLLREVTEDDIIRLTEIKIKRISKYNSFKADEVICELEKEIEAVKYNLANMVWFTIEYFKMLLEKFGKGRERKTEIRSFDTIEAAKVAVANEKLYVNRKEGFIGWGLKKDELIGECSDIDDIIVFLSDGKYRVSKVTEKAFIGKNILHAAVWKKGDERTIYNAVYYDAKSGKTYAKRFAVKSITRDRFYDVTKGEKNSKLLYFTMNLNSEAEIVSIYLNPACRARKKVFEYNFANLEIKGRASQGNIVSKWPVKKVVLKEAGGSTLGGVEIWYDEAVGRLNTENRGKWLGTFENGDQILAVYKNGSYELTNYELTNRYNDADILFIEKFSADKVISAIYFDGEKKNFFVKRFKIETLIEGKPYSFITEHKNSSLLLATTLPNPIAEVEYLKGRAKEKMTEQVELEALIGVKGWKAKGNRLSPYQVTFVDLALSKMKSIAQNNSLKNSKNRETNASDEQENGMQKNLFDE
jgi:topoisomerase-4 subunit A